jgi:uncharacterized protein YraI
MKILPEVQMVTMERLPIVHTPAHAQMAALASHPDSRASRFCSSRTRYRRLLGALLVVTALSLSACGPSQSGTSSTDSRTTAQQIALTYAATGDSGAARAALDNLDVANARQFLVYVTEQNIAENSDPATTAALVELAIALEAQSTVIRNYALQNGIAEAPAAINALPGAATAAVAEVPPSESAPDATTVATTKSATESTTAVVTEAATAQPAEEATATGTEATETATTMATAPSLLALATPTAAVTPLPANPFVTAAQVINVRSGPGTDYLLLGTLGTAENADTIGKNAAGDWWQVRLADGTVGWVLGQLVEAEGDTTTVAVITDIPAAPTAEPIAAAQPVAPEAVQPVATEAAAPAATEAPVTEATVAPPAADPNGKPFFRLVESRMWSKEENGGCVGQHLLRVRVIDANGVQLNGVRLKGIYTGEIFVTGAQGKGDGQIEYDLYGSGEGFMVVQNNDGRDVDSDRAEGFTTISPDIPFATLIGAGYCTNDADCQVFYDSWGCKGHHSWEATFQRNY